MNIAICDDNENDAFYAIDIIRETTKELHIPADVDYYSTASEVEFKLLKKKEPLDILILDIDMPEITGLQLASKLRSKGVDIIIIFLSAHEDFVFRAIEFQPFRYIRKIRLEKEMPIAIRSAIRVINANKDEQVILNTDNGEKKVMLSEIMYYEIDKRKIIVHLKNGVILTLNKTIAEMQKHINSEKFIMIHRGCVVNVDHVDNINDFTITLDNKEVLIVSRTRYKDVKQKILMIWGTII